MKKGKALLGVLAGLAAGAVLGVIFAPDKDSESRRNISRMGEDLTKTLNKSIDKKFEELEGRMAGKMKVKAENELLSHKRTETNN
ncbi:MAG: YtxH domain-containing protein [Cyclobacteriaceae bacterium]